MSFTKTGQVFKGVVTAQGALGGQDTWRGGGSLIRGLHSWCPVVVGVCRQPPLTLTALLTSDHHFGAPSGIKISSLRVLVCIILCYFTLYIYAYLYCIFLYIYVYF